jgi:hypothetical protein
LYSDGMSLSEEIKIIAFGFFRSKEIDGIYHSRSGEAKLSVFYDGWENLKFLLRYRKIINSALVRRPISDITKSSKGSSASQSTCP